MLEATEGPQSQTPESTRFCPVTGSDRHLSLDVLRGIAVLGILVMNIYAFAMPFIAYSNPLAMGGLEPHNLDTWFVTHVFFDQKFMSIFSMLFGAGLILMAGRADQRGANFGRAYYRRLFWLLLLGAAHGYLIWFGDILFHYALVGMFVYVFRNRSAKALIIIACLMLPVAPMLSFAGGTHLAGIKEKAEGYEQLIAAGETLTEEQQTVVDEWAEARAFMIPGPEELQAELDAYRGNYQDVFEHRFEIVSSMQIDGVLYFMIWRVGGLMLIGMALMKLGVLSAVRSRSFYRKLMLVGYVLGLPLTIFSGTNLYAHEFDAMYAFKVGMVPNYVGSILVALGHIGLVMLIVKTGALAALMRRFAAVGRMALSNYLAHSLILTTVFYGYGLGLFGEVPRLTQMAFVIAIMATQLLWSPWWLARFRFGPFEWLWRSLTYWQRQPMRL